MHVREIRWGNIIGSKTNPDGWRVYATDFDFIMDNPEDYFGIPLSPEWLERFSFRCDAKDWYWLETGANHYIASTPHGFYLSITDTDDESDSKHKDEFAAKLDIQFVHQLQNLYYCLCGKELELKP